MKSTHSLLQSVLQLIAAAGWLTGSGLILPAADATANSGRSEAPAAEQLIAAAMNGSVDRLATLASNGNVNATVGPGLTAWHAAIIRGRAEAAAWLEGRGANTNCPFPSPPRTVEWLVSQRVHAGAPGLALAVVQDGCVVFEQGWGTASLDYEVPITPSTVFHVASVSKQFTAFAIALLAQQGKLSVDDPLRRHLPEMHEFAQPITLRHLLYHTSGLRDQWDLLVLAGWRMDDVITQQDILGLLQRQQELNFAPGAEHLYCNSGYTLLAEVAGRVSGKPFVEFTREAIFQPLGMTNTQFHLDHEAVVRNMAYSYSPRSGGGYQKSVLNYANVGATSLFTTAQDLARWIAHFENPKLGGPEVSRQMQAKGKLNNGTEIDYGFGLAIGRMRGARTIAHGGADAGYRSHLLWLPDHHLGVVVLSNLGSMDVGGVAQLAAEVYLAGKLEPAPARRTVAAVAAANPPYRVSASTLDRYAGEYQGASGRVIRVLRDGEQLKGEITAGSMQVLSPVAEHEFVASASQARIVFTMAASGKAARYVIETASGSKRTYQRIDPADQVARPLTDYTGIYRSDELDLSCLVLVKDGHLVVRHRRHGEMVLRQDAADRFSGAALGSIRFDRDANGNVTGLRVTTGRVRNLRFDRQQSHGV